MNDLTKKALKTTIFLLDSFSVCWAQEGDFEQTFGDVQTVSIATGYTQSIQTAPAVASVITAQEIRDTGARNLIDILRLIPGFFIGRTDNLVDPVIAVRGFSSSFNQTVLFLLDGIPQTESVFGDRLARLGKIPLDIIDRVEVMRGPGSALYGADAYSAVVNIITQRRPPEQTQITLSGGSQEYRDVRVLGGGRVGAMNLVGALEYVETDGDSPFIVADQQTRLDALLGTHASRAPGTANTHRQEFGAQLNATSDHFSAALRTSLWRHLGLGTGVAAALDPIGALDTSTLEGLLEWHTKSDHWTMKGALDGSFFNYTMNDWHYFPPGAFGVFPEGVIMNGELEERRLRLQGTLDYTGLENHHFTVGVGAESAKTQLKSESRNFRLIEGAILPLGPVQETLGEPGLGALGFTNDLQFVYAQDEWALHPDWTLTWGLRYDRYSDFGDRVSPRAALVWNARHDLTAKLLYGRGFRTPSLLETQARQIPTLRGNPALQPESVNALELALDYRPRLDLLTRVNLFYHETDQQIRLQNTGGPEFRPENVGQQKGHGLELEAGWDLDRNTQLYGAYAYQDNTDATTGADAGYTPHHQILTRLQHRHHPWLFSLQARYVGARDRIAEDPRPTPDTYTFMDAFVRYTITRNLEASLDVRNLWDAEVEDAGFGTAFPGDIPLPGRTFYFSLTSRF